MVTARKVSSETNHSAARTRLECVLMEPVATPMLIVNDPPEVTNTAARYLANFSIVYACIIQHFFISFDF